MYWRNSSIEWTTEVVLNWGLIILPEEPEVWKDNNIFRITTNLFNVQLYIFSEHSEFQGLSSFQFSQWYWETFAYSSLMQPDELEVHRTIA